MTPTEREHGLTQADVFALFEYRDGDLHWRPRSRQPDETGRQWWPIKKVMGRKAGNVTHGYRQIKIGERTFLAHRLIFLLCHGWVPSMLDHINGNRSDNRIENLRPATNRQNQYNCKGRRPGASGFCGVYRRPNSWEARITVNGKPIHIGSFPTREEAIAARVVATEKYHGEFSRF